MKYRLVLPLFGIAVLLLSGCANNGFSMSEWFSKPQSSDNQKQQSEQTIAKTNSGLRYRADHRQRMNAQNQNQTRQQAIVYRSPNRLYQPDFSHKSLADYAEQLSMELVKNGQMLNSHSKVAVASFVNLDQSLQYAGALGNQLAELMIAEVQSFGVPVIDFKTTDFITVGSTGDLVFSRDAKLLKRQQPVDFVLSGTMIQNEKGVRVNARIINLDSKVVVSSASILIPHFLVDSLQPNYIELGD